MAQKNINIGTSANKGDGEPLRTAFDKINDNFTELYNTVIGDSKGSVFGDDSVLLVDAVNSTIPAENLSGALPALDGSALTNISVSSIDFSNVTNTPTTIAGYGITDAFDGAFSSLSATPTTIAGYGITDAFDGDYNSLSNKPTIPTAYTDSDVDAHLNQLNPTSGYVLSWNGADYAWVAQSGGGITDVVSDTTPQLGGDLDLNSNNITGIGNINITGTLALGGNSISGVGNISAGTLNLHNIPGGAAGTLALTSDLFDGNYNSLINQPTIPSTLTDLGIADGSVGNILTTNGAGTFTFSPNAPFDQTLDTTDDVTFNDVNISEVLKLSILTTPPTSPVDGMVVIADGTNWDPLSNGVKSMVVYLNSAWRQIAIANV